MSQGLLLLAVPAITRIYDPTAFGLFATVVALSMSLGVAACFGYDLAIGVARRLALRRVLYTLCWCCSLATAFVSLVGVLIAHWLGSSRAAELLVLIPLAVLFLGAQQATTYLSLSLGRHRLISSARVLQSLVTVTLQIGIGLYWPDYRALLIGWGLGVLVCVIAQFPGKAVTFSKSDASFHRLRVMAQRYRDFPIFRIPGQFVVGVGKNLNVFLAAAFGGPVGAGAYGLLLRTMKAPTELIGRAVKQGVYSVACTLSQSEAQALAVRTFWLIFFLGTCFCLALFPFVEGATLLLFGQGWELASQASPWLLAFLLAQLASQPVEAVVPVMRLQSLAFWLTTLTVVLSTVAFAVGLASFGFVPAMAMFCLTYAAGKGIFCASILIRRQTESLVD